jgi:putative zinc ribbon protein
MTGPDDIELTCVECSRPFRWPQERRRIFDLMGFTAMPLYCRRCRRKPRRPDPEPSAAGSDDGPPDAPGWRPPGRARAPARAKGRG